MDWDGLLNYLPGGPKAIHVYSAYIMPPMSDDATLEREAALGRFPTIGAIFYPAMFYSAVFGVLRMILTHYIFRVCADMEMHVVLCAPVSCCGESVARVVRR